MRRTLLWLRSPFTDTTISWATSLPVCRTLFFMAHDAVYPEKMGNYRWIEPVVSVRVGFREWTAGRRLRELKLFALLDCES